jgi:hypothetical protein
MHHATVVPDQQLARFPAVLISEVGMNRERVQLFDQRAPLVI